MSSLVDVEVLRPRPGAVVVECNGEHDLTTRDALASLLATLATENELVVIDVTRATFIDCSFLHTLVAVDRLARERGGLVRVQAGTEPIVRRVLEVSDILAGIEHVSSREEALAPAGALASPPGDA